MKKIIIAAVASVLTLTACGPQMGGGDQCAAATNPAECRQYSNAGGDVSQYLLYGMAGYMIGRMGSGQTYLQPTPNYSGYRPPVRHDYYRQNYRTIVSQKTTIIHRSPASYRSVTRIANPSTYRSPYVNKASTVRFNSDGSTSRVVTPNSYSRTTTTTRTTYSRPSYTSSYRSSSSYSRPSYSSSSSFRSSSFSSGRR